MLAKTIEGAAVASAALVAGRRAFDIALAVGRAVEAIRAVSGAADRIARRVARRGRWHLIRAQALPTGRTIFAAAGGGQQNEP